MKEQLSLGWGCWFGSWWPLRLFLGVLLYNNKPKLQHPGPTFLPSAMCAALRGDCPPWLTYVKWGTH